MVVFPLRSFVRTPLDRLRDAEQRQSVEQKQGRPQDILHEGAKPGTIVPIFFCYVWMPCCIPDPTVIEKVDFRLHCYVT